MFIGMPTHLIPATGRDRSRPELTLTPDISLSLARVHEACGPARRSFAMWLASHTEGPVLWIAPGWQAEQPHPQGMWDFVDPARFLFVGPRRAEDVLWCVEEALRAGAVPLVVADLPGPPALTPIRRMHLAAETGAGLGGVAPLGLLLTPGDGGAQGIESRWRMAPKHVGRKRRWQLDRLRARTQPVKSWTVTQRAPRAKLDLSPLNNIAGDHIGAGARDSATGRVTSLT